MVKHTAIGQAAPDFELTDATGRLIRLSDRAGEENVVLVFTRGFLWPYCRAHLAQLREQHSEFVARDAQIWVIGPEGPRRFAQVWKKHHYPFVGFSDYRHTVADLYGQEVNLTKLGRMPAMIIVDKQGVIRFAHFADAMFDIPKNADVLRLLDRLNEKGEASE